MTSAALVMFVVVGTLIWGGLALLLLIAIRADRGAGPGSPPRRLDPR